MKTNKNFNEISSSAAAQQVTNRAALNNTVKGAKQEIRTLSYLYFVNQLNKLAKRNEFVDGVCIAELGKMLQQYSGEKQLFTLRVFSPDYMGRPCYVTKYKGEHSAQELAHGDIVTDEKGNELRISASNPDELVTYRAVSLSLSGLITAYRAVLAPIAAEQDKAEREQRKAERKAERTAESKARAAARKALREQQEQARKDFAAGKMCVAEFAEIMAKVA